MLCTGPWYTRTERYVYRYVPDTILRYNDKMCSVNNRGRAQAHARTCTSYGRLTDETAV